MRKKLSVGNTALVTAMLLLSGCATAGQVLNPFYETPPDTALLGQPNDHALNDSKEKVEKARDELESVARYPRAHSPEPVNPVVQPAVVRLMWIPDHLNANGDLVPAHYYYLKVLDDRWAVTDVFDQKKLLGDDKNSGSHIPFVPAAEAKVR